MEQNISQIVQKNENLLFSVKISFSCLNSNNCPFLLQIEDEIMVYQVAQLCYEDNGLALKLYPDIATVTTRSYYFSPHSLPPRKGNTRHRMVNVNLVYFLRFLWLEDSDPPLRCRYYLFLTCDYRYNPIVFTQCNT